MKERLLEFLKNENKSSAQLADEIGVQASGISHILSGRNNPSLDFVLKMLEKYKFLSTDWLLFGKGSMYKEPKMQNLFDSDPVYNSEATERQRAKEILKPEMEFQEVKKGELLNNPSMGQNIRITEVVKIVWFYSDKSFEEYSHRD